jgi:hypothetical protein
VTQWGFKPAKKRVGFTSAQSSGGFSPSLASEDSPQRSTVGDSGERNIVEDSASSHTPGIQEKVSDNQQGFSQHRAVLGVEPATQHSGGSVRQRHCTVNYDDTVGGGVSQSVAAASTGRPLLAISGVSPALAGWGSAKLHTAQQGRRPLGDNSGVSRARAASRVQPVSAQAGGQLQRYSILGVSQSGDTAQHHWTAGQRRDSTTNSTAQRQQDSTATATASALHSRTATAQHYLNPE